MLNWANYQDISKRYDDYQSANKNWYVIIVTDKCCLHVTWKIHTVGQLTSDLLAQC